jgi:hypothetical protein
MSAPDPAFDRLVMAAPIVDMIGDGRMEYDGPRCDYCGDTQTVDDGDRLCPDCIGTGAA